MSIIIKLQNCSGNISFEADVGDESLLAAELLRSYDKAFRDRKPSSVPEALQCPYRFGGVYKRCGNKFARCTSS